MSISASPPASILNRKSWSKENAPELLRREMSSPKWKPQTLAMSGVTDCYQPIERKLQLTRRCLAVLAEFRNPVGLITKNFLVTRDLDLLRGTRRAPRRGRPAFHQLVGQRAGPPARAARRLSQNASAARRSIGQGRRAGRRPRRPGHPALNDHEMPAVLAAARDAGAGWAGTDFLRLPLTVAPIFEQWLEQQFSGERNKSSSASAPFAAANSTTRVSVPACAAKAFSPNRFCKCSKSPAAKSACRERPRLVHHRVPPTGRGAIIVWVCKDFILRCRTNGTFNLSTFWFSSVFSQYPVQRQFFSLFGVASTAKYGYRTVFYNYLRLRLHFLSKRFKKDSGE